MICASCQEDSGLSAGNATWFQLQDLAYSSHGGCLDEPLLELPTQFPSQLPSRSIEDPNPKGSNTSPTISSPTQFPYSGSHRFELSGQGTSPPTAGGGQSEPRPTWPPASSVRSLLHCCKLGDKGSHPWVAEHILEGWGDSELGEMVSQRTKYFVAWEKRKD